MPESLKIHAFRLVPGQDLKAQIDAYVQLHHIQAGWVMTCVGSLTHYHLRFANQAEGVRGEGHFEILSLAGTLSIHGLHLHLCLGDETGRTLGGHLLDGNVVYTTAELVIGESPNLVFTRENDGTTVWKELQISRADLTR
jgi:predicted DNA-binding protein with PD1-like motif